MHERRDLKFSPHVATTSLCAWSKSCLFLGSVLVLRDSGISLPTSWLSLVGRGGLCNNTSGNAPMNAVLVLKFWQSDRKTFQSHKLDSTACLWIGQTPVRWPWFSDDSAAAGLRKRDSGEMPLSAPHTLCRRVHVPGTKCRWLWVTPCQPT